MLKAILWLQERLRQVYGIHAKRRRYWTCLSDFVRHNSGTLLQSLLNTLLKIARQRVAIEQKLVMFKMSNSREPQLTRKIKAYMQMTSCNLNINNC